MIIKAVDTGITYDITARSYNEDTISWTPDIFGDREDVFAGLHDVEPGSSTLLATQSEVDDLIDFWTEEFKREGEGAELFVETID